MAASCSPCCRLELLRLLQAGSGAPGRAATGDRGAVQGRRARIRRARPLDAPPRRSRHLYGSLRRHCRRGGFRRDAGPRKREARPAAEGGALRICLILVGWRVHRDFPLVVAANRDEFHGRPAAAASFWSDRPSILAGRDLEAKGTWMGVSRGGRFAAVTNYRGAREPSAAESRGALVARFLASREAPQRYVGGLVGDRYSGFNLLAADDEELWWTSNRDGSPRRLEAGIYGLANALLDSPDVEAAKARFTQVLDIPAVDVIFD